MWFINFLDDSFNKMPPTHYHASNMLALFKPRTLTRAIFQGNARGELLKYRKYPLGY